MAGSTRKSLAGTAAAAAKRVIGRTSRSAKDVPAKKSATSAPATKTAPAAKKAGRISFTSFLEFEPDLLTKIDDARRRAVPVTAPPILVDLTGPDVRSRWVTLTLPQKREVVRTLCTVYVHKAQQGARTFDPSTVTVDWRTMP